MKATAKNETMTYTYQTVTNNLLTVTGPVTGATTTYTYDAYGRVQSTTDADGYQVITDYDHLNRLTQRTYPDNTTEANAYSSMAEDEDGDNRVSARSSSAVVIPGDHDTCQSRASIAQSPAR